MNQSRFRAAETKRCTTVQKFYSKISIGNDCWLWMGRRFRTGYGASDVSFSGKIEQRAHRAAYRLFIGSIPNKRIFLTTEMPACMLARNERRNHQDDSRGRSRSHGAVQETGAPRRLGKGAEALGQEAQRDSEGGGEEEVEEEKMLSLIQRFWKKVNKTESCWLWTGCKLKAGYGQIHAGGSKRKMLLAHRVSWEIHHGAIPLKIKVLHECDNPPCVNPDHLFLGTNKDNTKDMFTKGRWRMPYYPGSKGEKNGNSRLITNDVLKIRSLRANNLSQKAVAKRFGINKKTVSMIEHRITWKHI